MILVEVAPSNEGWTAIVHGEDIEPHVLRLPDGYDPRDDRGELVAQMLCDGLNAGADQ